MKQDALTALSLEHNAQNTLVVVDLDNTLVHTNSYLKRLGLLTKDYLDEQSLIKAYVRAGESIVHAPANHKLVHLAAKLINNGVDVVIITARVSVPAQITLKQVRRLFKGNVPDTYISLDKGTVVNTLIEERNKEEVIVIDDVHSTYSSLRGGIKVHYYTPEEV